MVTLFFLIFWREGGILEINTQTNSLGHPSPPAGGGHAIIRPVIPRLPPGQSPLSSGDEGIPGWGSYPVCVAAVLEISLEDLIFLEEPPFVNHQTHHPQIKWNTQGNPDAVFVGPGFGPLI